MHFRRDQGNDLHEDRTEDDTLVGQEFVNATNCVAAATVSLGLGTEQDALSRAGRLPPARSGGSSRLNKARTDRSGARPETGFEQQASVVIPDQPSRPAHEDRLSAGHSRRAVRRSR